MPNTFPDAIAFELQRPHTWSPLKATPIPAGYQLFTVDTDGTATLTAKPKWPQPHETHILVAVHPGSHPITTTWAGPQALFDGDWVLRIHLSSRILAFSRFYQAIGRHLMTANSPITKTSLALELQLQAYSMLRDAMEGMKPDQLTHQTNLHWWNELLTAFATSHGLELVVRKVEASSDSLLARVEHNDAICAAARRHELDELRRTILIESLRQDIAIRRLQGELAQLNVPKPTHPEPNKHQAPYAARIEKHDVPEDHAWALTGRTGPESDAFASDLVDVIRMQLHEQNDHPQLILPAAVLRRDVTAQKWIPTIQIHAPLNLVAKIRTPGYLSLLNIGSSCEHLYLQVPGQLVTPADCLVHDSSDAVELTKSPMMHLTPGYQFTEMGPPGWERFILLRTDELLWTPDLIAQLHKCDDSFYELFGNSLDALVTRLKCLKRHAWSAAALGFHVVR